MDLQLNDKQNEALEMARYAAQNRGKVVVLSGPAGTGKTSSLKVICAELPGSLVLTPTGRAALRAKEVTGQDAITIHRWLYKPVINDKTGEILSWTKNHPDEIALPSSNLIIIDEASMIHKLIWEDIRSIAQYTGVSILLVGDEFQLPPVTKEGEEEFSVFYESFPSDKRVSLTEVFRQALDSPIIRVATELRKSTTWRGACDALSEFVLDSPNGVKQAAKHMLELAKDSQDVSIISYTNAVRHDVNRKVRLEWQIDPDSDPLSGEPLLIRKNSYNAGVFNGQIVDFTGFDKDFTFQHHRFGNTLINDTACILSISELLGGLAPPYEITKHLNRKYVSANLGYCLTCHACVVPDTLVETPQGLMPMSKVGARGMVATQTGPRHYTKVFSYPASKCLKITTKEGYTITVTPEHGLDHWDGKDYSRIEASALKVGDWLRLRLGHTCEPTEPVALPPAPAESTIVFPERMTEDFAEWLGIFIADGLLFDTGFRVDKIHKEYVDRFSDLTTSLFGVEVKRSFYKLTFAAEVYSNQLVAWLKSLNCLEDKDIPHYVLESPRNIQAKFLRGLCEASIINLQPGRKILDSIELLYSKPSILNKLRTMLLRFGIICGKIPKKDYDNVSIFGTNAQRFGREIGFIVYEKTRRVLLDPPEFEFRHSVPVTPESVAAAYKAGYVIWDVKKYGKTKGCVSRRIAQQIPGMEETLMWHHSRIESIKEVESPSMCLEIPETHMFLQNGFGGWNSQGSEWDNVILLFERKLLAMETIMRIRWTYTALTRARKNVFVYTLNN